MPGAMGGMGGGLGARGGFGGGVPQGMMGAGMMAGGMGGGLGLMGEAQYLAACEQYALRMGLSFNPDAVRMYYRSMQLQMGLQG